MSDLKRYSANPAILPDGGESRYDETNAVGDLKVTLPTMATKVTEVGSTTYVATARPGTAQATAEWQAYRVVESGGDTVITWADGNTNFDNVATDLTALSYS